METIGDRAMAATAFRFRDHFRMLPGLLAILLAGLFYYPGTHFLTSDTQIWTVMLEHQMHPQYLAKDLLAQYPHIGLSFYDEIVNGIRSLTGLPAHPVMYAHLVLFRIVMLSAAYLLAFALCGNRLLSVWMVAAIQMVYLITGPSVCVIEVEPVPRAFSMSLGLLAVALFAQGRRWGAAWALGISMLFQAVMVYPVLLCLGAWILFGGTLSKWTERARLLLPVASLAIVVLSLSILAQGGSGGFFATVPDWLVEVQRIRASYNWVSLWRTPVVVVHVVFCVLVFLSAMRLRQAASRDLRWFLFGIPVVALLSIPVAWIAMEKLHLMAAAQTQPARALATMYATGVVMMLAAGALAAAKRRWPETFGWLAVAYGVVFLDRTIAFALQGPSWQQLLSQLLWPIGLAACATLVLALRPLVPLLANVCLCLLMAAPFAIYRVNFEVNIFEQDARTPEVMALSAWAEQNTGREAVFLFPGFEKSLQPGVFRAAARRAVYVDWKSGGQVNFDIEFSRIWWERWNEAGKGRFDPKRTSLFSQRGIDYLVLAPANAVNGVAPSYQDGKFIVYRTADLLAHMDAEDPAQASQ